MSKQLKNNEFTLIDREGEKIKQALTKLVNSFPIQARAITGMAGWLNSSKTTCQRVIESINANNGIETIIALPGPSGLKKFLKLTEAKNLPAEIINTNDIIINTFETLIAEYSTSHSALKSILKTERIPQDFDKVAEIDARKKLFEASSSLLNEYIDVNLSIFLQKENDLNPNYLQQSVLSYYKGCRFGENSRPLVVLVNPDIKKPQLDTTTIISTDAQYDTLPMLSFVKEFTSENILKSTQSSPHSSGRLVMNNFLNKSTLSDVAILKHYEKDLVSPSHGGQFAGMTGVEIRNPTRRLVHLCFMKKTLAIKSLPEEKVVSVSPGFKPLTEDSFWFNRLHTEADITILQPHVNYDQKLNIEGANHVIETFFSLTKNNPNDYLGYLMKVEFPIWSSAYLMRFPVSVDGQ